MLRVSYTCIDIVPYVQLPKRPFAIPLSGNNFKNRELEIIDIRQINWIILCVVCLISTKLIAQDSTLKVFKAGEIISADEVNANFKALEILVQHLQLRIYELEKDNQNLRNAIATTEVNPKELKKSIISEVLTEIQNEEAFGQMIDAGIQRYVAKQKEAQETAKAEQERVALEKAQNVRPVDSESDHIYGNHNAVISLIVYSDFECPYCKSYYKTPKQIVDESNGTINWVYRHYPLNFHNPGAQKQAEAVECAVEIGGNDVFWKFTDTIYERTASNGQGFPLESLRPLAEELGLSGNRFEECLKSEKYAQKVKNEMAEGTSIGISGTPSTIIRNNKSGLVRVAPGALPISQVRDKIQELLP